MIHFVPYDLAEEAKGNIASLRGRIMAARMLLALCRFELLLRKANFNPNQPRVPRGSSDGGQWTDAGGSVRPGSSAVLSDAIPDNVLKPGARVAQAGSRGSRGSTSVRVGSQTFEATPTQAMRYSIAELAAQARIAQVRQIDPNWRPTSSVYETVEGATLARRAEAEEAQRRLAELARLQPGQLIETYRNANSPRDLFGRETWPRDQGTVAVTTINQAPVVGVNSSAPPYTARDRVEAQRMVDVLAPKYPQDMSRGNIGQIPNDALYHAEANVLLRAARANGGSLAGQHLEVSVDRPMCDSCRTVLPRLGLELGNPSVTFVSPNGGRTIMRNGKWER